MTDSKTFPLKLNYWHLALAVGLMAVAFALRFWTLLDRAAFDLTFDPFPGSDMATYYNRAREFVNGTWPDMPYDGQPGLIYWYGLLMQVVGQEMIPLRVALAGLDAVLGVGFVVGAGWLLTRRAWGGLVVGLVYAVYPVSVFYGTTFLIAPVAAQLYAMFFFVALWQRLQFRWWRVVWLGLIFGALVAVRINLAPIAAIWVGWLWLEEANRRRWVLQAGLAAGVALAFVAPFTYWNYYISGGEFQFMTQPNADILYAGNDRDTHGIGARSPAYAANDLPGAEALARDIAIAPEHFVGLLLRKAALHWSAHEAGNGVDFGQTRAVAAALQWLPLTFTHLAVLGLLGWFGLWYADRRLFAWFGAMLLWLTLAMAISFGISRLRYPTVIPMMLLGGYALVYWWDVVRAQPVRLTLRRFLVPALLIAGLMGFVHWALSDPIPIPPKRTYAALPADATPTHLIYHDAVELVGYRAFPAYWPAPVQGWVSTDRAYTLELFWRVVEPTDIEYQFFLAYIEDGQRRAGFDYALGGVSFPAKFTTRWQPGEIYGEIVSFRFEPDTPIARSGRVHLGVYYWDEDGLIVNTPITQPIEAANAELQTLAVFPPHSDSADVPLDEARATFGDFIALRDYTMPATVSRGAPVELAFAWAALQDVPSDYTLFVHVVDAEGEIAAQRDAPPVAGLFTANWQPGYALDSTLTLNAPDTPGTYRVYAGLYDAAGRLPVAAPDDRFLLGELVVR